MSEVNKPESHPEPKCPINPEQYNLFAPVGSFPWALSQMFLGNKLHRSNWAANTYVYYSDATQDRPLYISSLGKSCDYPWSPEQQDMIAGDWALLKPEPEKPMLSFDIKSRKSPKDIACQGPGKPAEGPAWGYSRYHVDNLFGELEITQNTINISSITDFYWNEPDNVIFWGFTTDNNNKIIRNINNLMYKKSLYVTVANTSYNLGQAGIWGFYSDLSIQIKGAEAQKLGALLKQEQSYTFSLTWLDN